MNNLFNQMLAAHTMQGEEGKRNALYEVMQQVTLAGLARGGFFQEAAFYGGTCLRLLYGLQRYSEDMDFTLLSPNPNFCFENYFPAIIEEARLLGREVTITKKDKRTLGRVESAFLKDTTDVFNLNFQTERSLKIKIEVDTQPPLLFQTEQKLLVQPYSFMVRSMTLPCLFAGKMHALVFRQWKNRVKGRDWYDFEWYVRWNHPLSWAHLHERIVEFSGKECSQAEFIDLLQHRLETTDIQQVKADVLPFVKNPRELDIWSNEYFLQLAQRIRWNE